MKVLSNEIFPMNCELNVTAQEMVTLSTSQGMWVSGTRHIARKRLPHSPSHRSRSSPVRSELSCCGSPVRRGRSPSVSRAEVPAPPHLLTSMISTDFTKTVPKTQPAVAYYSAQPPSTPLYLLPISASYTSHKSDKIQQLPNPQVKNNDGNEIVKKILRLILKNAMKSVGNEAKSHPSHHMQQVSSIVKNCDIAIQTTSSATNRHFLIEDEDICSFSSESGEGREGWQWDVRALRDSHVRLVLRQLRQLSDIERLARALRRNPYPHRRATSHHNPTDI